MNKKLRIADDDGDPASTWTPVPLGYYIAAEEGPPENQVPTNRFLVRSGGPGLIYPGRCNGFYGPSEIGKSWIVTMAARDVINAGGRVLWMDFEDSGAEEILFRLISVGTDPMLMDNLLYMAPEGPPPDVEWKQVLTGAEFELAVIDAVSGALVEASRSGMSNDDVTAWMKTIAASIISYTGAAVIVVDHAPLITKQNRVGALGAQAKRATITGASYRVQPVQPLIRGKVGILDLYVDKDKPGRINEVVGASKVAARVTFDATDPDRIITSIDPPPAESASTTARPGSPEQLTEVKERLSMILEKGPARSLRTLRDAAQRDHNDVQQAIGELVADGYVRKEPGAGRAIRHILVRPFRSESVDKVKTTGAENDS